ncbi:MAG TPA: c-type cytochrome [Kofleriaceae bacterium]
MNRAALGWIALLGACDRGGHADKLPPPRPAIPVAQAPVAKPPPPLPPVDGKGLYTKLCAVCHAADGKGDAADHAPSLVTTTFLESASNSFILSSILNGRAGTSMGAYAKTIGGPLESREAEGIVAYLRTLNPTTTATLKQPPRGHAEAGAPIYQAQCQACHGDAKTRGVGISLANPQFQQTATDAFLLYAIQHGRPGTKMPPFPLTDEQAGDVIAYVRSIGAAATEARLLPPPTGNEPLVINPKGAMPPFTPRLEGTDPRYVPAAQVKAALDAKQRVVIIDARPPSEWRQQHIPGAVSIPYHDMKRLSDIPKDGTWVIAYCACPHHLSGIVVDQLRALGYTHSAILDEGILEWQRRGYPIVLGEGIPRPPRDMTQSPP